MCLGGPFGSVAGVCLGVRLQSVWDCGPFGSVFGVCLGIRLECASESIWGFSLPQKPTGDPQNKFKIRLKHTW